MSDKLEFKISSALKSIVGKDLITSDYVAIFEIVKNSFDAKATYVQITFEDDSITIADNGKGMSLDDIKNKWLFLAYSAKRDGSEDIEYNSNNDFRDRIQNNRRYYAGAKGIGRFSADRLGQKLELFTKTHTASKCEKIIVDWRKFEEDQKKEFIKIGVDHEIVEIANFPDNSLHGTILHITRLNDSWTTSKLRQLRRSLEKLINPFGDQNKFTIEISCPRERENDQHSNDYDKINGILRNTILDALNLKTTLINVEISHADIITEIKDRGAIIYKIKEPNMEPLLSGTSIKLLFLNRSARHTFTLRMGLQAVDYGSIFLYKNGFRIYPYGEPNDDSWGIDSRKQQGYNRYLGSRDLIGRVEINTIYNEQFKETSSRDGGLVQTQGSKLLLDALEKAHRRLERYVAGVLWGEGFKRRGFFINENIAEIERQKLAKDKDLDDISDVKSNLGSRLDFTQIIKSLAKDDNVEILEYNQELTQFIADELKPVKIDILKDVEEIAVRTGNEVLKEEVEKISIALKAAIAQAEEAERQLQKERDEKEAAQRRAEVAEQARKEAEENRRKEELARKEAQLKAQAEELKRKEAELQKKEAEQRAKEEEEKRLLAESEKTKAEKNLSRKKEQLRVITSLTSQDLDQATKLHHQINVVSDNVSGLIKIFSRKINSQSKIDKKDILSFLNDISLENDKINSFSRFGIKKIYDDFSSATTNDIIEFINAYVDKIATQYSGSKLHIIFKNPQRLSFNTLFAPIDISIIIDNMISNAKKLGVTEMQIIPSIISNKLHISIITNKPLDGSIEDPNILFELGFSTTKSTGLGLYHIKNIINQNGWQITINPLNTSVEFVIII
ncbi:ATP-binding protein [Alistipes timonensis]|uniref:ATP-binding protein n=1 Tax=Alistipes timonensis TaxID=1465754 RepID=UPI001899B0C1|nr:ATP-binding protein [Alistipes timonensis]